MNSYENLRTIGNTVLNMVFPPVCIFCMKYSKDELCLDCRRKLILSEAAAEGTGGVYRYGELYCFGKYIGILRDRFIEYKFKKKLWLGVHFGRLMFESFKNSLIKASLDLVTYVPVSKGRFKDRGFDQSFEMASAIAKKLHVPCIGLLKCVNGSVTQSGLKRNMRISKVKGRFELKNFECDITGKRILLVDDIFTTGATLNECAYLLSEGGAVSVDGMVFATGRADIN